MQVSELGNGMYQNIEFIYFFKFRNYSKCLVPGLFKTMILGLNLWKSK